MRNRTSSKFNLVFSTVAFATTALAVTGCGAASTDYYQTSSSSSGTTLLTNGTTTSSTGTIASTTTTVSTTTTTGTNAPYSYAVSAVGYTSTTETVSVGTVLKVKFAPGVQNTPISGTSTYPQYSQLGVYIQVGSVSQATPMLTNGYNGTTAETSGVLDFSTALPNTCSGSTTCRQSVTITVMKPNYDYWCLTQGIYCPWTYVDSGHSWNGTLTIQTDDTTAI